MTQIQKEAGEVTQDNVAEPLSVPLEIGAESRAATGRQLQDRRPGGDAVGRRWWASRGPVLRFVARFAALTLAGYVVLLTPWGDRALYAYLCATARVASFLLRALGQTVHASGLEIQASHFGIAVRRGCDAVEPSWFFCAAVLAFPAPWRNRLTGMLAGILVIGALNLVRVVSLYLIGVQFPAWFEAAHLEIWPAVFVAASLFLWFAWLRRVRRPKQASSPAAT